MTMKLILLSLAALSIQANTLSWSLEPPPGANPLLAGHLYHAGVWYDLGDRITGPRFIPQGSNVTIGDAGSAIIIRDGDGDWYSWILRLPAPMDFATSFTVPITADATYDGQFAGEPTILHLNNLAGTLTNNAPATPNPEPSTLILAGAALALLIWRKSANCRPAADFHAAADSRSGQR